MRTLLSSSLVTLVATGFISLSLLGCEGQEADTGDVDGDGNVDGDGGVAPDFEEGQGQAVSDNAAIYPEGPYGLEVGSVIEDLAFTGFPDPSLDRGSAYMLHFSDFYNPTGTEVYGDDTIYETGKAKPKALWIVVSAVWCVPCQQENRVVMPALYEEHASRGLEFVLDLDQDYNGNPAKFTDLVKWTKDYKSAWPSIIDPKSKLQVFWDANAFPANILVDTKTMKLVDAVAGAPQHDSNKPCSEGCAISEVCNPYDFCTDKSSAEFFQNLETLLTQ